MSKMKLQARLTEADSMTSTYSTPAETAQQRLTEPVLTPTRG